MSRSSNAELLKFIFPFVSCLRRLIPPSILKKKRRKKKKKKGNSFRAATHNTKSRTQKNAFDVKYPARYVRIHVRRAEASPARWLMRSMKGDLCAGEVQAQRGYSNEKWRKLISVLESSLTKVAASQYLSVYRDRVSHLRYSPQQCSGD